MKSPWDVLPGHLIWRELVPLLDPVDAANFFEAYNVPVTREFYDSHFHDKLVFETYNPKMLRERAQAKLYLVKVPLSFEIPILCTNPGSKKEIRTHMRIEGINVHILNFPDHKTMRQVFTADKDGMLYTPREILPPFPPPFLPYKDGDNRSKEKYHMSEAEYHKSLLFRQVLEFGTNFGMLKLGRDTAGRLWGVLKRKKARPFFKLKPVIVRDVQSEKEMFNGIRDINMFTTFKTCLVKGEGLYLWKMIKIRPTEAFWVINAVKIPGTETVKEYACGDSAVLCLTAEGTVFGVDSRHINSVLENLRFEPDFQFIRVDILHMLDPFAHIGGNSYMFMIVCQDGVVYQMLPCLTDQGGLEFNMHRVHPLEELDIAEISVGLGLIIVLTTAGEVYTSIIKAEGKDAYTMRVLVQLPTRLNLPRKAFNVYADHVCTVLTM